MNKALRVADYLGHILQAIERINRYTRDMDEAAFLDSELVQDAVIRNIEIIGEAANNVLRVDPAFAAQHNDVPWLVMYTMRNRVSHGSTRWIWKSSGRRSRAICLACANRCNRLPIKLASSPINTSGTSY